MYSIGTNLKEFFKNDLTCTFSKGQKNEFRIQKLKKKN